MFVLVHSYPRKNPRKPLSFLQNDDQVFFFFPLGRWRGQAGGRCWCRMLLRGPSPKARILVTMFSQRLGKHWFMHQLFFFAMCLCVCGCAQPAGGRQGSCFRYAPYPLPTLFLFPKCFPYCTSHGRPQPVRPCL